MEFPYSANRVYRIIPIVNLYTKPSYRGEEGGSATRGNLGGRGSAFQGNRTLPDHDHRKSILDVKSNPWGVLFR